MARSRRSNNSMQRTALRAAAEPERWADKMGNGVTRTDGPARAKPILRCLQYPGPALQVGKRDDNDLVGANAVDDLVRETGHEQPAGLLVGRDGIPGLRIHRQSGNRRCELVEQLSAESHTLRFVPANSFGEFKGRERVNPEGRRHRPRTSRSMRRRTSSQGSRVAVPASMAPLAARSRWPTGIRHLDWPARPDLRAVRRPTRPGHARRDAGHRPAQLLQLES